MYKLLTIQEIGSPHKDDQLYPVIDTNGKLVLDDDEHIVWQGTASALTTFRYHDKVWRQTHEVGEKCFVTVTNQRIVYVCEKFNTGNRMSGAGLGSVIAVAYNAKAASKEAKEREGKALVGQVRHEWPRSVITQIAKKWPITTYSIQLNCITGSDVININFYMSRQDYESAARIIAEQIAAFRHMAMPEAEPLDNGRRVRYIMKDNIRLPVIKDQ